MNAWILAGGLSSRFGSDKAVYLVGGVPMVLRIATAIRASGLEPGLVSRHPRALGLREIIEGDGPRHPLHGVATALAWEAAQTPPEALVLVCPCDLAALTADQVRVLVASGPSVALGQPLLAVLPVAWVERAAVWAASGRSVRSFVADLPTVDLGPVENLNTPP